MLSRVLSVLLAGSLLYVVFVTMSTVSTSASHSSLSALEVRVQSPSIPASFSPPIPLTVKVTVVNTAGSPVTLLNWGSVLDPRANVLGPFEIRDADSNEVVTLNTIKFARQLPPPREDFVEIPPSGSVDAEVTIPLVPLVEGHRYIIQAKGWWQAVWEKPLSDVPDDDLQKLAGAERGSFESDIVPINIEDGAGDLK